MNNTTTDTVMITTNKTHVMIEGDGGTGGGKGEGLENGGEGESTGRGMKETRSRSTLRTIDRWQIQIGTTFGLFFSGTLHMNQIILRYNTDRWQSLNGITFDLSM